MIYRFGVYRLDSERDTLADANGPVALRDHALRVLKLLLERAPEVVTKDQILAQVWGHDALSESAIPQVIKDIRQVLGDSAKSPEFSNMSSAIANRWSRRACTARMRRA